VVDYCRAVDPACNPILPAGGYNYEPALTFANDVLQKILFQGMNWRWNESYVPLFLTNCLQQDYPTNITDIGWLTSGILVDINNSSNANNLAPKPIRGLEVNRSMNVTPFANFPTQACFIINNMAMYGTWSANTSYPSPYGVAAAPATPFGSFVDANSNIWVIDSSTMQLTINSPGYPNNNSTPPVPVFNPYGVTGDTKPVMPPNTPYGTTMLDGTVTWTCINPNAYSIRFNPLPGMGGLTWLCQIVYQRKAPKFNSLQNTISPIPDDYAFLFRQGFLAKCLQAAGSKNAQAAYQQWEEQIDQSLRASTRELDAYGLIPDNSMSENSGSMTCFPAGPSSPFASNFQYY
jgi:hypothetical protein